MSTIPNTIEIVNQAYAVVLVVTAVNNKVNIMKKNHVFYEQVQKGIYLLFNLYIYIYIISFSLLSLDPLQLPLIFPFFL